MCLGRGRWFAGLALRQVPIAVLDHHNGGIYKNTNRQRQTAQRHNVRGDVQVVHGDKGGDHRNGQSKDGDECGTEMEKKNDDDGTDDDRFLEQLVLQSFDGVVNQTGAVVSSDDLYALGQRRLDLSKLLLDAVDDIERIHSVAHHDDSADGFSFALPLCNALADIWPKCNCS